MADSIVLVSQGSLERQAAQLDLEWHLRSLRDSAARDPSTGVRIPAIGPQLTAFFTSALILASSAAVNSFSAKALGHMLPSSRFALSLKPKFAYLVLNFAPDWKKQTTLSSLAYACIPYQSLGARPAALSLMIVCSRLAMARSGSRISAIFASTALSPSPLPAFISWTRFLIAPRSSSVNALLVTVLLLADWFVPFCVGLMEFDSSFQSLSIFSRVHFSSLCLRMNLATDSVER